MPCEFFRSSDGSIVGVMCSRGRRQVKPCYICGKPHTSLCDYPVGDGNTCDRPMCDKCRTMIGPDLDVCRAHSDPVDVYKTQDANKPAIATAICPRCQNSEIKSTDNFCKICGLKLMP